MPRSAGATASPSDRELEEWEARAELDIGTLIHSYLLTHPAPERSELVEDLESSAEHLLEAGFMDLDRLGRRRLQAVGG